MGAPGPRPQDDREVPRSPRRRALQADQAGVLRRRRLDHPPGVRAVPERDRLSGPVSHRQGRHRRAGQGPPRGLERGPPPRPDPARPRAQGRPVRAVEEPREPDRAPTTQAGADPETQPAAVPRLPALPAAAPDLPRPRRPRARAPRRVAEMGTTMPARAVRQGRPSDHRAAPNGRGGHHEQALQRRGRAGQHPDPPDHPTRLRLPLTLGRHRPRDALTRRPLPTPTRTVTPPTEPAGDSQVLPG